MSSAGESTTVHFSWEQLRLSERLQGSPTPLVCTEGGGQAGLPLPLGLRDRTTGGRLQGLCIADSCFHLRALFWETGEGR